MPKNRQTTTKRPKKPFTGVEGKTFSKDNQPTPEAKKNGWEEWRKERRLSQGIMKKMLGKTGKTTPTLTKFLNKLIENANAGNPKAIDVISKCLEDDVIKIEHRGIKVGKDLEDETYE